MNNQKGFVWIVVAIVIVLVVILFWNKQAIAPTAQVIDTKTTTTPIVATPITPSTKSTTPTPSLPGRTSAGAYLVYFTKSGFSPVNLSIPVRSTVRFYNSSNLSMSIMTLNERLAPYSTLNQGKSVGKNAYFDFAFVVPGSYAYKNLNAAEYTGIINVR